MPAEASTPAARSPSGARRRKGNLRERVALDREQRRLRNRRWLGLLPRVLVGLGLAAGAGYLLRAPALRLLARSSSSLAPWATERLAALRDPASFDLYLRRLGYAERRELYNEMVFFGGGRTSIPTPGSTPPPDDPTAVAAHLELIERGLEGEAADVRRGCLYALWTLQDRPWTRGADTLAKVAAVLDPPCEDVIARRFAAMVLKAHPAPAVTLPALLRAAFRDEDRDVRRIAVEALGHSETPAVASELLPLLRDHFPEVRREASLALARLGYQVPLESLVRIYREDIPSRQSEALELIAERNVPEATELLIEATSSESPSARLVAVRALGRRPGPGPLRALERALRDPNPSVRIASVEGLAERPDGKGAVPELIAALHRHEGWQEISAIHSALRTLTGHDVPSPTPLPASWGPVVEGWDRFAEQR